MSYLIGIGAQKAGTTWLAGYFYAHSEVFMSPYKEMRYFDARDILRQKAANWRLYLRRRNVDLTKYGPNNSIMTSDQSRDLHRLYLKTCLMSDRAYKEFLDYGSKDKKLSVEISPGYSDLDEAGYRHIARCLPDPKLILIARNPVDRFISQVRMDRGHGKRRSYKPITYLLSHHHYRRKGDYKRTLIEAEKAVGQDRIHVVFFERLFDQSLMRQEVQRICDFLDISYERPADIKKSNAARDATFDLDDDERRVVARHYGDVMKYMARYEGGLPDSWRADLALL